MQVEVNGTRLWFDVDDALLAPDGAAMRVRPTVMLLRRGSPTAADGSQKGRRAV